MFVAIEDYTIDILHRVFAQNALVRVIVVYKMFDEVYEWNFGVYEEPSIEFIDSFIQNTYLLQLDTLGIEYVPVRGLGAAGSGAADDRGQRQVSPPQCRMQH